VTAFQTLSWPGLSRLSAYIHLVSLSPSHLPVLPGSERTVTYLNGPFCYLSIRFGHNSLPLAGEGCGGGACGGARRYIKARPPPPSPPYKGGGDEFAAPANRILSARACGYRQVYYAVGLSRSAVPRRRPWRRAPTTEPCLYFNRSCTSIDVSGTSVTIISVTHRASMNGQMDRITCDTEISPMAQPR
jgi:hypothetical protein